MGDEPLLVGVTGCPVWIGRAALAGRARIARTRMPACRCRLSDDGLPHYRLARDVEIVAVVDGTRGLGTALLLPAGPLREPAIAPG